MNTTEHLITILGEEGAEIAQDCSKCNRFGLQDINFLTPGGPTNVQRLVDELNDLEGVKELLVQNGILPADWRSEKKIELKKRKVLDMMQYARDHGSLE